MNLTALLSWYHEDPAWLYRAIRSLEHVGATRLIAIDGAYGGAVPYPDGAPSSTPAEHEAIHAAAAELNLALTLVIPETTWQGGEIEKRTALFRHADVRATADEWYLVLDADEVIRDTAPADLHERLEHAPTGLDVADVTFIEATPFGAKRYPIPIIFRAIPGITVVRNHYTYTVNGRTLWGNAVRDRLEPRLDLTDLEVDHHTGLRATDRREAARAYYHERDAAGIERDVCHRCKERKARRVVPHAWTALDDGSGYVAEWLEVCDECAPVLIDKGKAELRAFGVPDPDRVTLYDMPGAKPVKAQPPPILTRETVSS